MQHRRDPQLRGVRGSWTGLRALGARGAVLFLGLGTGRGGLLLPLLFLLLAQTEASFEFLGPGTGQTRTVTAQRNKTIDQETLGKDLGKAAADGSGHGTQDGHRQ